MTHETRASRYAVLATQAEVRHVLEVRRSEFISYLLRAEDEEQARAFIETLRKRHHDARHVCSAFVLGADRTVQRSSDDGEPSGTAGVPMLQALLARRTAGPNGEVTDLSDICAVVVRYFGGIKLGAGGLVRAYTDAVVAALDAAPLTARERLRLGAITAPHSEAGRYENDLRALGYPVLDTSYTADGAVITLGVCDAASARLDAEKALAELTSGAGHISWGSTRWVDSS